MSKRCDDDYLLDILEALSRIAYYVADMSYEHFCQDTKTQDAVIRNLEIIGEAVKHISTRLKKANPHIPWRDMAGARDKLIHHYFGINYEIIWTIASVEAEALKPKIEVIRAALQEHE